jgi:hypothetical protein
VAAISLTGMASGLSPDPRILSLIPHDTEIADGSGASPSKAGLMSFLVFRQENAADLRDFIGLLGVDNSKAIRQIFLLGGTKRPSARFEHSVIALGRFNHGPIYKGAIQNGARTRVYRGMEIVELDPFSRDEGTVSDVRWLAVVGSDLAVLGTISSVREELDHYADHAPPDSSLIERFGRLRGDDETWCILSNTVQKDAIRQALGSLDARFLDLARDESQFQFGIHYGTRIRFDYESAGVSNSNPSTIRAPKTGTQPPTDTDKQFSVAVACTNLDSRPVSGVISVSRTRYEKWLSGLLNAKIGPGYPPAADHTR